MKNFLINFIVDRKLFCLFGEIKWKILSAVRVGVCDVEYLLINKSFNDVCYYGNQQT